jgi:hypothetical protein
MWWDWTQISLMDAVLFSFLSTITLYFVGSGFIKLICALTKKIDPFGPFDFLVKTNFRILFGFIFIFLFVFIFSIFNVPFLVSTVLIIIIAVIGFVATRHSFNLRLPKKIHLKNYVSVITIILILFTIIFLSSALIAGFYGSTNDDGADHTFFVRVILDNPNGLLTRSSQPYANFFVNYPSGTHVLCAFFVTLLNVAIQKIVMMMSAILPFLIAVSIYSTVKCLFGSKVISILGLMLASFFTIGSWAPISWGGLPVLISFYLLISSMGLIFVFLLKKKMTFLNASLIGLIFFIALETYPVALLMISLWFLLILSAKLFPKFKNVYSWKGFNFSFLNKDNIKLFVSFFVPILFGAPYLYSFFMHNAPGIQSLELNPIAVVSSEVVKARIGFDWVFNIPALSLFFSAFGKLLALAPISLVLLFVFAISLKSKRTTSIFPSKEFMGSLLLVYLFTLLIMSYLTLTLYLPINSFSNIFDPQRVLQHVFIPAIILTAIVIFAAIYFSHLVFKRIYPVGKPNISKLDKKRILGVVFLVLVIFNIGLLLFPIVNDEIVQYKQIKFSFGPYETISQNDLLMMNWLKENISSNSSILVSSGDSGQFVTSVTKRQTISRYSYLENYENLMALLTSNSSDLKAIPLMIEYNVSYVYIGSIATTYALQYSSYRHFHATQFLSTPYFTLTKEFGDAWLFQFNVSAADVQLGS